MFLKVSKIFAGIFATQQEEYKTEHLSIIGEGGSLIYVKEGFKKKGRVKKKLTCQPGQFLNNGSCNNGAVVYLGSCQTWVVVYLGICPSTFQTGCSMAIMGIYENEDNLKMKKTSKMKMDIKLKTTNNEDRSKDEDKFS